MRIFLSLLFLIPLLVLGQTTPTVQVKTLGALTNMPVPMVNNRLTAIMAGQATTNDGGGGLLMFDSSDSTTPNTFDIFSPASGSGRWRRTPLDLVGRLTLSNNMALRWRDPTTGTIRDTILVDPTQVLKLNARTGGITFAASAASTNRFLYATNSAGDPLMLVREDGRVAFGMSDPTIMNEEFEVRRTRTSHTENTYGIRSTFITDLPTNGDQFAAGLNQIWIPANNTSDFQGLIRGTYSYVNHDGTGNVGDAVSDYAIIRSAAGWITNAYGVYVNTAISGSGSISNLYGVYISPGVDSSAGSIANEYGLFIGNIAAGTGKYSLLVQGSAISFFNSPTHFGGDSDWGSGAQAMLDNGTQAEPALTWASDVDTGLYRPIPNTFDLVTGGNQIMRIGVTNVFIPPSIQFQADAGSLAVPGISFAGDGDTGFYRPAANTIDAVVGGGLKIRVESTNVAFSGGVTTTHSADIILNTGVQIEGDDGTVTEPSYSFGNDLDTGIYRPGNNSLGIAAAGANAVTIDQSGLGSARMGVQQTSPTSTIHSGGSFASSMTTGGSTALSILHSTYLLNVNAGTVTLPTAVGIKDRIYTVKLISPANTGTIATTGGQLIDGSASISLTESNQAITVQSDNSNWKKISIGSVTTADIPASITGAPFIMTANDPNFSAERALAGTANQVILTDGGANAAMTLSLPQNIHTGASPTFVGLTLSGLSSGAIPYSNAGVISPSTLSSIGGNTGVQNTGGNGYIVASSTAQFLAYDVGAYLAADTESLAMSKSSTAGYIRTGASGTGTIRPLRIGVESSGGAYAMEFNTDNVSRFTQGVRVPRRTTAGATTLAVSDYYLACTAGGFTVTLPDASTVGAGFIFVIKDASGGAGAANITLDPTGADTVDGAATYVINVNFRAVQVISDGANNYEIVSVSP